MEFSNVIIHSDLKGAHAGLKFSSSVKYRQRSVSQAAMQTQVRVCGFSELGYITT